MKTTARTLLAFLGVGSLATVPLTGCQDLAGDCDFNLSCAQYAQTGGMGGADGDSGGGSGDGDGDGDGDGGTGGRTSGGTGGGDGGTGGTTPEPCDGACKGKTPNCNEDTDKCVGCRDDEDCSTALPVCDTENGNTCVQCLATVDCADGVCDVENTACVECLLNADCGDPDAPACDTDNGNTCVECVVDGDCKQSDKAKCDTATNSCVGCDDSVQCAEFTGTEQCELNSGECVACLDETHCEGKVCDPVEFACTEVEAQSMGACDPCQYDGECMTGQVCVEMSYSNPTPGIVGNFCLWRMDSTELNAPGGACGLNSQPYSKAVTIDTVDGQPDVNVCQPRATTCPGVKDHATTKGDTCTVPGEDDDACGAGGFNDAVCRKQQDPGSKVYCTYSCAGNDDQDCPKGIACVNGFCEI